jgi:DNA-binding NtrC family response regulator
MGIAMREDKTQAVQELPLEGARVLVVEDEYYIADDLRRTLDAAGARVVGPCSTLSNAHEALDRGDFDCAVIDLNLHGDSAVPLADRLIREGHSFAIATGYGSDVVPDRLKDVPRIEKPFDPPALLELIKQLSCAKGGGLPAR